MREAPREGKRGRSSIIGGMERWSARLAILCTVIASVRSTDDFRRIAYEGKQKKKKRKVIVIALTRRYIYIYTSIRERFASDRVFPHVRTSFYF